MVKRSTTVYLDIRLLEEAKRRKINLSRLVNDLLENFFFSSNSENLSEELLKLNKLEAKLEEKIREIEIIKKELQELKEKYEEKEKEEEFEETMELMEDLREKAFPDLQDFEEFKRRAWKSGSTVEDVIMRRLRMWAAKRGVPEAKAFEIFRKAFPDLEVLSNEKQSNEAQG